MMHFDRMPPVSLLKGANLIDAEAHDYDWAFAFEGGVGVLAAMHWRLLNLEAVVVTDQDHGQPFGLKEPVDAASLVRNSLGDAKVTAVTFRSPANDLVLSFSNGWTLEVLVGSGGYENWHVHGPDGSHTFAAGGGSLNHLAA